MGGPLEYTQFFMKYLGSKRKIAKFLIPIMELYRKPGQYWVEPFVGGANLIEGASGRRIGNDNHSYLIALLKAVQNGYEPPIYVSRELYYEIKDNPENFPDELVGFVGFLCSFGGRWFEGYAHSKGNRNYGLIGKNALKKQAPFLKGIEFTCVDYRDMKIPNDSLIYCDPPYKHLQGYGKKFDSDVFWDWCRLKKKEGHQVFISEVDAPEDFKCIWERTIPVTLNKNKKDSRIERLFVAK